MRRRVTATAAAACLGLALSAPAAEAGSVYIEDHAVLEASQWQLNSVWVVLPTTQQVGPFGVQALPRSAMSVENQLLQEFRYGITDRLLVRTTLPMSMVVDGQGALAGGWGEGEAFLKALLLSEAEAPLNLAVGLQALWPLAGAPVFSPSVMLNMPALQGRLSGTLGYNRALGQGLGGLAFQPDDSLVLGLSWDWDVSKALNLAWEVVGTDAFAEAPDAASRVVTAGPSVTWLMAPGREIQASLQLPVLRRGMLESSQPVSGMLQYSWTL